MCHNVDLYKAVYTQTTRGKEQLLFYGQPFIYEKSVRMPTNQLKRFWRCNQWCANLFKHWNHFGISNNWLLFCTHILFDFSLLNRWNQKCRARVFTLGDVITPLQENHTHSDVIHRKKRVAKKRTDDDKDFSDVDFLLVPSDKKDQSEDEEGAIYCVTYDTTN